MGVDGAYYLCKEQKLWPFPNVNGDQCLVYSFGIDWDFKFDNAIASMGCEVHAFDPCEYFYFNLKVLCILPAYPLCGVCLLNFSEIYVYVANLRRKGFVCATVMATIF